MKLHAFLFTLGLVTVIRSGVATKTPVKPVSRFSGVNGGAECATCTILVGLVEQLMIVHNTTVEKAVDQLCGFLPSGVLTFTCNQAVEVFGSAVINGLYMKQTPDVICNAMKFCKVDPGRDECRLFDKSTHRSQRSIFGSMMNQVKQLKNELIRKSIQFRDSSKSICDEIVFKPFCTLLNKAFKTHKPTMDLDNDGFGLLETLRGTSWRGKDCNDFSSTIYPGTKPIKSDAFQDSNCNGIHGKNEFGQAYEDLFCKDYQPRGIAVLGDSVSAHFHVPDEWLDASQLSKDTLQHLLFAIENELDWPQFSYSTGHKQNDWPIVKGNTSSLYLKLWQRNKCNFRDYQNIAVNGADSNEMLTIMKTLSRNQTNDYPLIVIYSLVGNDVCNAYPNTFANMTTLQAMHDNLLKTMQHLDTVLPKGSHILLTGLANGSVLYDELANRIHPLGRVKNDVKYPDVYSYLSCLELSPCNGYLTTNATVREMTTEYARQLSGVIHTFTQTQQFNNFDMAFFDFPLAEITRRWKEMGGEFWQLIEPVDGFHVNQFGHAITADIMWEFLEQNYPDWLGPINPFNDQITQLFGNQGGY